MSTGGSGPEPDAFGGRVLFRLRGIPVQMPLSGLLGVGLIAFLWSDSFRGRGPLSPIVLAIVFAVLLYASIVVHEVGHALVAHAFGYRVHRIVLWILGGVTVYERGTGRPWREAAVAAAGPAGSLAVALAAGLTAGVLNRPGPESAVVEVLSALAVANVFMAIYNLIPGLPLDGGAILKSVVWAVTGNENTGTKVAAYGGFAAAALILALPVLLAWRVGGEPSLIGMAIAAFVALFVVQGALQALSSLRVMGRVPLLRAGDLARRAIPVERDMPVSEGLRRMAAAAAGAMVVVDATGSPSGIVHEAALAAVPIERRPWVPLASVARSLDPAAVVPASAAGEALIGTLQARPSAEYLVVDEAGLVVGVLATADIEQALRG